MNKYDLINEELAAIVRLQRNNIIQLKSLVLHQSIYDRFYELDGDKGTRYLQLADEFNMHHKSIQKIIIDLNTKIR